MISKNIINAVLKAAAQNNKDAVISFLIQNINRRYDYNDEKTNHILEMLLDDKAIISVKNIDFEHITQDINGYVYESDKKIIENITINYVDNIDCTVNICYDWKYKIDVDRGDIDFNHDCINISFINCPKVLKKS